MARTRGKRPPRAVTTTITSGNPDYLRQVREDAGVSLRDLGSAVGVSPTYVHYLEQGVKPLSLERLETFESAIKRLRAARESK
jgi:transcriptional regulator with XRE-family HTH domain